RDIAVRRSRAVSFSSPCLLPTAQVISWCGTSIACGRSTRRFKKGIRSRRLLSASCRTTCTPYDPCRKVMRTFHCAGALSRAVSLAGSPATDGGQPAKSPNRIWQRRYWEHAIRHDTDLARHVDYIHFNPVKHGYARRVCDWPYSSFDRYVARGLLPRDWGGDVRDMTGAFGE